MKKQKICIIGGSLTGLITAISLSKLNCEIDLVIGKNKKKKQSNKTIAISENNFNFIKKLNIASFSKKEFWPCSIMSLYEGSKDRKFTKIFELNNEKKGKKIFYMTKNTEIIKTMMQKIKKTKSIKIKKNENIAKIYDLGILQSVKYRKDNSKYNLIIVCTGNKSDLVKNTFYEEIIEKSYDENSITTVLQHKSIENKIARQIFLKDEIFAFLPISNNQTSIVWSVKKKMYKKNKNLIKSKIKLYSKNFLDQIQFKEKIEFQDLSFLLRKKYFKNRILLFGDALHYVHPLVGQGFNMTLRDLSSLQEILNKKINLGLDIGSFDILSEFSNETKPRNFAYAHGINLIKNSFSVRNDSIVKFRNNLIKLFNKNSIAKDVIYNFADKGLKF